MAPFPPPGPPGYPPGGIPPQNRRDTPWWVILLYVMGGFVALGVLGTIAFFGLVAFACGKH